MLSLDVAARLRLVDLMSDSAEALARKNEEVVRKEEANAKRLAALAENKATSRSGSKVQQAGYQVADFATQVGAGTSAVQALSQQLPQFLGAFGPWGAVIGAAVAVVVVVVAVAVVVVAAAGAVVGRWCADLSHCAQLRRKRLRPVADAIRAIVGTTSQTFGLWPVGGLSARSPSHH